MTSFGLRNFLRKVNFQTLVLFFASALLFSLTFSKAFTEIAFLALLVSGILRRFADQDTEFYIPKRILFPLGIFLGLVVFTSFFSEYPANSIRGVFKIFKQAAIFLLIFDFMRDEKIRTRFESIFLIIVWLVLINGLCQYTLGRDFLRWKAPIASGAGLRVSAGFGSYGMLASFLITAAPYVLALGLSFQSNRNDRARFLLAAFTFGGFIFLLILTRSRGAILAFALAIAFILLLRKKPLAFLFFFLIGTAFISNLPRNMVIHLDAELKEQSLIERFYLWDRAVQVIRAKPLTGTGINTYNSAHAKYDKRQNWRVKNYYAHNGYLQLAAETGIPCVAALFWFFWAYFKESLAQLKKKSSASGIQWSLLTGLIAFLIFCTVDTAFQSPQPVMTFWFFLGLQLAYAFPKAGDDASRQQILDRKD